MATVLDKHKLKDLLKSLIEEAHYQAVVAHVIAKKIKAETHRPIEDINAAFDEMHEMLEEVIDDEDEAKADEDPE